MSISYDKDKPQDPRFFLLFGSEGAWQEVTLTSYVSAKQANGLGDTGAQEDFTLDTLRGTVTTDGSRPADIKPVVKPMVRRSSDRPDASVRLIFPEGSYSVASVGQDSGEDFGPVTVILSLEQYKRFLRAQAPVNLDGLAEGLNKRAAKAGSVKGTILGTVAEVFAQVAQDMRDDKPTKRPTLQELKDALRG